MYFSYNFIQEFISKKMPKPGNVADLLTMHSFEVEGMEKFGKDWVFDIDILPNRAHDAASHVGMAREVAALMRLGHAGKEFTGAKLKEVKELDLDKYKNKKGDLGIEIKDKQACRRYLGVAVEGVKVKESPKWLKDHLEALGLNSINNVVDAANYAMLATGQPLHAFDLDKIDGNKIIVRSAKEGEKITTLDDEEYKLSGNDLVIADASKPLAIAGIKGGKSAEVDEKTSRILLESAWFDPMSVRVSSGSLGLRTDASWRFEHEIPLSFPEQGLSCMIDILEKVAGGSVSYATRGDSTKKSAPRKITLRPEYVESMLGAKLSPSKISAMLKTIGFDSEAKGKNLAVSVPAFRPDIKIEEDLVEEAGRLFGYENIVPEMPSAALYPPKRNDENYWLRQIRSHLSASGFNEIYTYSFVSEKIVKDWNFYTGNLWELRNPVSEDFKYMRPSLLPYAVKSAKHNMKFFESVELFEIGEVFCKRPASQSSDSGKAYERPRLSMAIGGREDREFFYELKGRIEALLNSLGISDIWFDDSLTAKEGKELEYLHPFRRAQIKTGNACLGYMGQVSPKIAGVEKIKGTVVVADIDIEKLTHEAEEEAIYTPVSLHPQSVRDISVLVPSDTKTVDILNTVNSAGGNILRDIDMFDYYEEDNEGPVSRSGKTGAGKRGSGASIGKKSMAFHLIFQAEDRTLNSKEIDEIMAKIEKAIKKQGWDIK